MKQVGWEVQPLGWLLMIVVLAGLCYFVVKWARHLLPPPEQEA